MKTIEMPSSSREDLFRHISTHTADTVHSNSVSITSSISAELTEKIMSELAIIGGSPSIKKAQAVTMIRLAGGLHLVHNSIVVNAELPTERAAKWLKKTLEDLYKCSSMLLTMHRALPMEQGGHPYVIRVLQQGARLAVQTGLLDKNKRPVKGLPMTLMNGNREELAAIWRGAFLARGRVADPIKKDFLMVSCSGAHVALALSEIAKHLGIMTHTSKVDDIYRISLSDRESIYQLLLLMNAQESAQLWAPFSQESEEREENDIQNTHDRSDGSIYEQKNESDSDFFPQIPAMPVYGQRQKNCITANNMRSEKAAQAWRQDIEGALKILGDDIPSSLRQVAELRLAHPYATLQELANLSDPQMSKSTLAGRLRRLRDLGKEVEDILSKEEVDSSAASISVVEKPAKVGRKSLGTHVLQKREKRQLENQ